MSLFPLTIIFHQCQIKRFFGAISNILLTYNFQLRPPDDCLMLLKVHSTSEIKVKNILIWNILCLTCSILHLLFWCSLSEDSTVLMQTWGNCIWNGSWSVEMLHFWQSENWYLWVRTCGELPCWCQEWWIPPMSSFTGQINIVISETNSNLSSNNIFEITEIIFASISL